MTSTTVTTKEIPFSYLDELMGLFDVERSPTSVHLEIRVEGRLDEAALRTALAAAAARHPLMRARELPTGTFGRCRRWSIEPEFQTDPLRVAICASDEEVDAARDELFFRRVRLDQAPPFRALLIHHAAGDWLILNAVHQATDGIGLLRFLHSVRRAYAGEEDPPAPLDLESARDLPRWLRPDDPSERRRREAAQKLVTKAAREAPTRLAVDGGLPRGADTEPMGQLLVNLVLTPSEADALRALRRDGATINDVLIGVYMMACDRWNALHGAASGLISATMPMNFRPREWQNEIVGNYLAVQPVMTMPEERRDIHAAIAAVRHWTQLYKDTGCCGAPYTLAAMGRLPIFVKRLIARCIPDRSFGSGALSNLGSFSDMGSFGAAGRVSGCWFSPPVRWPMAVCTGAVTLGGQMFLTFRCSQNFVDRAGALRFADVFRECIALA